MPTNTEAHIITADALTLLLHNQHGIAAALEELANWIKSQGGAFATQNALTSLQVLDDNAQSVTDAINRLRQL